MKQNSGGSILDEFREVRHHISGSLVRDPPKLMPLYMDLPRKQYRGRLIEAAKKPSAPASQPPDTELQEIRIRSTADLGRPEGEFNRMSIAHKD